MARACGYREQAAPDSLHSECIWRVRATAYGGLESRAHLSLIRLPVAGQDIFSLDSKAVRQPRASGEAAHARAPLPVADAGDTPCRSLGKIWVTRNVREVGCVERSLRRASVLFRHVNRNRAGAWCAMDRTALLDELRQIERDVVDGERRLAEQEALIIDLKRQHLDTAKAESELERMREDQRRRDLDRQRLLSRLQP